MVADRSTLENLLDRAYSLYILLLEFEHVPGNTEEFREVLFTFVNDLSMEVLGV